ncbi:MAG TPA: NADP transhydrogenase subunit alpha [Armatimonadetes bacterium]|nr:NADP transhydrogenase subunit alpha [Armatimonadota bacterium]
MKPSSKANQPRPRFCVLGAGHGGQAMAADLALRGFPVHLYNRSPERLEPIKLQGGIELVHMQTSLETGRAGQAQFVPLEVVTTDMAQALEGVDILMVVVPANGHRFMAEKCAEHLQDGQIVVLNPGRTGGALEFVHILNQRGVKADVIVAEAQTFIHASRCTNPAQVTLYRTKNNVPVAALPAYRTPEVVQALRPAYPQFVPGDNVLKTSLNNIGAIFHPAIMIMNTGRIESTDGDFEYYVHGVTPSVAQLLEKLDAERVAVSEALGIRAMTAREWLYVAYDAVGRNLFEAMRRNLGYKGIKAPATIFHRYITEDVPMSLVPMASFGNMLGVPTPVIHSLIHIASALHGTDFWAHGRTVETLGLQGMSVREIRHFVLEGTRE